ncbi:phosphomevalonate kinase [Nadsonia fulvescens var. elongata DSM 6958]|uniref:Phosphomevalonate kinase n=1 Tax=Nadsonia fulvescens var. elongata DSM 6958 TaxID=857566 RepID=A0A1E3PDI8_9ASCO|nr:phosphomevalonate kinase [Nadsonia fulvescens var. elongata DSM 6958]
MAQEYRAFSAPGKALLAGGYLVLDPAYGGYVTALSARIHAVVKGSYSDNQLVLKETTVSVKSPQFKRSTWTYTYSLNQFDSFIGLVNPDETKNPFAEAAVNTVLAYVNPVNHSRIEITIFSDDAYHSQDKDELLPNSEQPSNRFHWHSFPISDVPKTGLGSSAALTSALTTAILLYYKPELDVTDLKVKSVIHNLSQLAHCTAQKKIGSGFDVASAVCGSIVYKRFPESTLSIISDDVSGVSKDEYSKKVRFLIDQPWDITLDPCNMPGGLTLLMGDINGGSETPKLVSKVLAWRKADPEDANKLWADLNRSNMRLVKLFNDLNATNFSNPEAYNGLIAKCASLSGDELAKLGSVSSSDTFSQVSLNFQDIRHNLRLMTEKSGAPIEPPSQTKLLDNCNRLPGVLGGVVPGAGGFDAICLVVFQQSLEDIKKLTKNDAAFNNLKWLDLHEEKVGVKEESLELYKNLF